MRTKIAFGLLLVVSLSGGFLASRASSLAEPKQAELYKPMEPFSDDPNIGGRSILVGNGEDNGTGRRLFLEDGNGNLEIAVQYQVKLPNRYARGGEFYRLVVRGVNTIPSCCGTEWDFDTEVPLEPFSIEAGQHVNDVIVVNVPRPQFPKQPGVRVSIEVMTDDGEWEEEASKTIPLVLF